MIKKILLIVLMSAYSVTMFADEGMWLPLLLKNREADMKAKGMKISAKDIYDVNNASLKDAVMLFGGGCTGEFVSDKGLTLTNHHCGYSYIVSHSTVERDYLTNGFWAMNQAEELPCKGLSVTLLVYMEDVTAKVLNGVTATITENERDKIVKKNIADIVAAATKGTTYKAEVEACFYGNQYFLYVNDVFTDVRLVGAPPSNIGKFGGDTDNWMYPRHTGDFSIFRVYAGKDNKPAPYSKDNVPYKPKKHLKISLNGVKEGDFTFVFGYPGRTQQFLTSYAVAQTQNEVDPTSIKYRTARLDIYNAAMNQSPAQRLRYASQVASIANGWKKWQGEVRGLKRLNAIVKKQDFEKQFGIWANIIAERKEKFGGLLPDFAKTYSVYDTLYMAAIYFSEGAMASDIAKMALQFWNYVAKSDRNKLLNLFERIGKYDEDKAVDKAVFLKTMTMFYEDYGKTHYAWLKEKIDKDAKGDAEKYFSKIYDESFLTDSKNAANFIKKYKLDKDSLTEKDWKQIRKLQNNPLTELFVRIKVAAIDNTLLERSIINTHLDSLYRIYVEGIMEMQSGKDFYPDANLTLRVAYGNVMGYQPKDAVTYLPYTTIEGIMQKENPDIYDYVVEPRLKELYANKDYGRYANSKGELPVTFIASNHTTGGNSGSPVLNAEGNLIGINFDRNWEGTMSDIMYDPSQCRNISLDIRYCLFIIDKYAGAKHLIEEMDLIQ
ncbi:MAG: S46 family peptidase [Bacteroidales bacterium]|jgi:hypothetical protein|nr:S46 family peptidase [Bacteroidales bacterium]